MWRDDPNDRTQDDETYWDPDPDDPDWDLTEAHGYSDWEPRPSPLRPWMIALVAVLFLLALLVPLLRLAF
ncbi:MAG TPA: hypothetical protein VNM43_04990 [Dehalococcoidia bacterium]|nr:hypothetical protein [Dehalococcoidia bacterium]